MAATKEGRLELIVNGDRFVVDLDNCLTEKVYELTEKVEEIRIDLSPYGKYPFKENETKEEWVERVSQEAQEDFSRKKGEKEKDHLKRVIDLKSDLHKLVPKTFKAVAETFGQKAYTEEELKKVNWIKLKRFLYDVLTSCDIPAEDLRPILPNK